MSPSIRTGRKLVAADRVGIRWCSLALALVSLANLRAAEPHVVVVDDYFSLGLVAEIAISPKAQSVAYSEGRWQESTNDRKSDLWIAPTSGQLPRRITFDRAGYDTLRWGSDGKHVYCAGSVSLAGGPATRQILRVAADGSGTVPVSRVAGGIESYEMASNGQSVVYTTSSDEDSGDWSALRSTYSQLKYGTRKRAQTSLYRIDLATWRTTPLATFAGAVDAFSLSPDEQRLAMVTAPEGAVITMEGQSELTILEVATGTVSDLPDDLWRKDAPSPYGRLTAPKWSSDGKALAFAIGFDAYPSEVFVAEWKGQPAPTIRKVKRPGSVSLHGGVDGGVTLDWKGAARDLCFLGDDRGRVKIYCASNATGGGAVDCLTDGDMVVDTFAWDREGESCAAVKSSPDAMHDVFVYGTANKQWKQLTEINAHAKSWKLPRISIVKWAGQGGKPVEGLLELPPDYQPGSPLPTIVNLHGGPTSAWPCNMLYGYLGSVLYASQGYAYFSPNYRGSTGYGDAFMTDLVGHENDIEVADILEGVNHLIVSGVADKDRIGVAGWSNGGYLTNCLISTTDRFKAASSGAGIVEQAMEWGTNDEPAFPQIFSGGTPWQVPHVYRRSSPLYQFGMVKTPTLFHVGEGDLRCPKGQSETAFRALQAHQKVPTELLIYPGEGHGLSKYSSRKAKMAWELAWFDHYLRGKPKP